MLQYDDTSDPHPITTEHRETRRPSSVPQRAAHPPTESIYPDALALSAPAPRGGAGQPGPP